MFILLFIMSIWYEVERLGIYTFKYGEDFQLY